MAYVALIAVSLPYLCKPPPLPHCHLGKAADKLSDQGVVATFASGTPPHRNAKDIAVANLSVTFHGAVILESTDLQLNYGNRYGLIGRNGSGKSTLMRVIGSRAVPIADSIDIYHLTTEYPATESTALEAVMSVRSRRFSPK